MRLEDAIKHADEKGQGTSKCAAEHRQLAAWLKELLRRRETDRSRARMKRMVEAVYLAPRT